MSNLYSRRSLVRLSLATATAMVLMGTSLTAAQAAPIKSILFVNPLPKYPAWRLIGDCVAKEAQANNIPATESGPTDGTLNTTMMMQQVQQGIANEVGAIVTFPATDGFMPLLHKKNTDFAAFIGAQSLQKPAEYDDPDATANAALGARLPYMFACCRFAHYLKCIVRDKIGSFKDRTAMERWLGSWINQYVDGDPANSSEETKARKPLSAAEVVVEEVEGAPGYYTSKFFLKPHYQLEGLTVSLRLVSRLPSAAKS